MDYVVTGGAGFIGSHVVSALLDQKHGVVLIDNFSTGKRENIEAVLQGRTQKPRIQVLERDICSVQELCVAFAGAETVMHLAARPRIQYSIDHPQESYAANVRGTENVIAACGVAGVKRLVFASSSSVYGDQEALPLVEAMTPHPKSPYADQKLRAERAVLQANREELETIALRFFNVYGPRQDPSGSYAGLIPTAMAASIQEKKMPIYGDGEQTRDFTYVGDVVRAVLLAATTRNAECFGKVCNIGAGNNASVNHVVNLLDQIGQRQIQRDYQAARQGEVRATLADITRAKTLLGWQPETSLEEGLRQTHDYYKRLIFS